MQFRLSRLFTKMIIVAGLIAACQGGQKRTEFLMEVTVEVTRLVPVTVTPEPTVEGQTVPLTTTSEPTSVAQALPDTWTPEPEAPTGEPTAVSATNTLEPSATPDVFPTPLVAEIIVAEQEFQTGRMFYLDPLQEIWIMTYDDDRQLSGDWSRHEDRWEDGMEEMDPELAPPAEGLAQPIRGFGLLWRQSDIVQDALGWAVGSEFGHVTTYRYEAGGDIIDGEFVPGTGVHLLNSRIPGTTYIFDESNGRWSIAADPSANQ